MSTLPTAGPRGSAIILPVSSLLGVHPSPRQVVGEAGGLPVVCGLRYSTYWNRRGGMGRWRALKNSPSGQWYSLDAVVRGFLGCPDGRALVNSAFSDGEEAWAGSVECIVVRR